jgi:hypothetical protein
MVRASGHIEQALSQLQAQTAVMADDFEALYHSYFETLGQATQRQLSLAAYHLCTRVYPEQFLTLSFSQREKLQRALRQIGAQVYGQLLECWSRAQRLSRQPERRDMGALLKLLQAEAAELEELEELDELAEAEGLEEADGMIVLDEETLEALTQASGGELVSAERFPDPPLLRESRSGDSLDPEAPDEAMDEDEEPLPEESAPAGPLEPTQLLKQQLLVEKSMREVLKSASETANYLLQQANVVPNVPKGLLAAAAESEGLSQAPMKMPNLLKISVKIMRRLPNDRDPDQKAPRESGRLMDLAAFPEFVVINLRLSEIEFAENSVMACRSRLREKLGKLKQLGTTYQKTQRELAIAQAEDAWRASWIED